MSWRMAWTGRGLGAKSLPRGASPGWKVVRLEPYPLKSPMCVIGIHIPIPIRLGPGHVGPWLGDTPAEGLVVRAPCNPLKSIMHVFYRVLIEKHGRHKVGLGGTGTHDGNVRVECLAPLADGQFVLLRRNYL
jgi:hypothetical protein